jgi:regulation of enolase protein 1 (concanavalin A-like superfamily)
MDPFVLPALPAACEWQNRPADWKVGADGSLAITAGGKTDWFIDPAGSFVTFNAPAALFTPPDASCLLSAKVSVSFASAFDAGVLLAMAREDLWAKVCFEYSPQGRPMVVSVVTRGASDDCNSTVIEGREVYLRVAMTRKTFAFHYSSDGRYWHLVRYFSLGAAPGMRMGFLSQSPTGEGCEAVFTGIVYGAGELKDIRSGE